MGEFIDYSAEAHPAPQAREPELLTHSRAMCAAKCLRMHQLRYELLLEAETQRESLRIGVLYHGALERSTNGADDQGVADWVRASAFNAFEAELVLRMWMAHRWYYQGDGFEVVENEQVFEVPIRNPESGRATPNWKNAGKRDRVLRLRDARLALQEYKTTTDDISPGSDYWLRLRLDQQVSRYVLAAREAGHDIRTVVYDVTRRPQLRPLKATPIEDRKFTKAGTLYANQRLLDETPSEYGDRVQAAIVEAPEKHFQRHEIARTDDDIREFEQELWDTQKLLSDCRRHDRWYRNANACTMPWRCDYLSICAEPDLVERLKTGWLPPGFKRAEKHPELAAPATE